MARRLEIRVGRGGDALDRFEAEWNRLSESRRLPELHVLTLEDAIRKMTWAVAQRLSIHDRGMLHQGMYADVVIFDPNTIIDRATYEQPHQLSAGVREVFVNGVEVVRDGHHTGAEPGMMVRGPGYGVSQ